MQQWRRGNSGFLCRRDKSAKIAGRHSPVFYLRLRQRLWSLVPQQPGGYRQEALSQYGDGVLHFCSSYLFLFNLSRARHTALGNCEPTGRSPLAQVQDDGGFPSHLSGLLTEWRCQVKVVKKYLEITGCDTDIFPCWYLQLDITSENLIHLLVAGQFNNAPQIFHRRKNT